MQRKILIMGLPGAGKTSLARQLAPMLNAVIFNNDEVRANINRDLGFSMEDRIEQARRMGWLCDRVAESGGIAMAIFFSLTAETRSALGNDAFIVFVDRIEQGRLDGTNKIFVVPERYALRVAKEGSPLFWAEKIVMALRPTFEPRKPTALFIGRFQPFHVGHQRLIQEGLK